jgi:hypothetical protein
VLVADVVFAGPEGLSAGAPVRVKLQEAAENKIIAKIRVFI